jgi:hypothetical protein
VTGALNRELALAGRKLDSKQVGSARNGNRTRQYRIVKLAKFGSKKNSFDLQQVLSMMDGNKVTDVIMEQSRLESKRTPENMQKIARKLLRRLAFRKIAVLRRNVAWMKEEYGVTVPNFALDGFARFRQRSNLDHDAVDRALKRKTTCSKEAKKKRKKMRRLAQTVQFCN